MILTIEELKSYSEFDNKTNDELSMMEKGIDFNVTEMETLIESAVAEFNEAFKK